MEGGDQVNFGNGGSRWNPTKEQIDMLEALYREGLKTPSAEQIQHITKRLQDFGHIEGKNVFYWFQNHKARQRQKQKQENTTAFYNRFFHSTPSAFPPYHHNNVVRSQSFIAVPKNDIGLYQHYPKVPPLPAAATAGCFKRRLIPEPILERRNKHPTNCTTQRYNKPTSNHDHQETLNLFPMHPTGLFYGTQNLTTQSSSSSQNGGTVGDHQFYDFFCGKV